MNRAGLSMIDADSLDEIKGLCIYPLVVPKYREAFKSLTEDVFKGKSGMLEFEAIGLKGRRILLDTHAVPLRNDKDEIIASLGITRDVTEHKWAEIALRESEKRFRILFNSGNDAIGVHRLTLEGVPDNFIEVNDVACQRLGYSREELLDLSPTDIDDPNNTLDMTTILDTIKRDKQVLFENVQVTRDGRKIPVEINARLFDWDGKPTILSVARDITERKRAEEALKDMNAKLRALINTIPDMVIFKDIVGRHVVVNRAVEEVTGHAKNEIIGKTIEALLPPDPAAACRKSDEDAMRQSVTTHAEEQIVRKDGSVSYFDMAKAPMTDDRGAVIGLVAVGRDITERKQMEEDLRRSSREKDTLLQEIHHRVKNNMQVISSLLNLQAKSINDPRMSAIFEDCQSRIRSMALVHEELYQSKNLSHIDIKHYINALLHGLSSSVYKKATVRFKVAVDDLFFDIDTAIPCGLIITELATNSFKHAFPKQTDGELSIELHQKEDMFHLSVKDNGVGLPQDFDIAKTRSLGLQLIHTLARQLGGTVEMKSVQGAEITIAFKERKNKKEVQ
jgi:PAS domain S-box-containing protein